MRLSHIRRLLDEAAEEFGDGVDPIVKLATQQRHSLAYSVYGVFVDDGERSLPSYVDPEDPDYEPEEPKEPTIWVVEGSPDRDDPYGVPQDAWDGALR